MRSGGWGGVAVLLAATFAAWGAAVDSGAGEAPAGPRGLVCEQPVFEFGDSTPDQVITHTFVLRNAGADAVRILSVRSGCGCTTTTLSTNQVAPSQSAELLTHLDLKGRKGVQRKPIYVETDAPAGASLRLEMAGMVHPAIDLRPDGVHFGTLARDGVAERDVQMVARSNVTFHVKAVRSSSPGFSADAAAGDGKTCKVTIRSLGPRSAGTRYATVQVETDLPEMPLVSIPVTVFVASDIVAAPAVLVLVQGATNETRTYYVGLSTPSGKPFKVPRIDLPRPDLECKAVLVAPDRQRLEIRVPGRLHGLDGTSIRIATDVETMPEVVVPLRVVAGPDAPDDSAQR